MKFIGLLIGLLFLSTESWACWCVMRPPLTADILKTYPYVALVKVVAFEKFKLPGNVDRDISGAKFTVEVIENFKSKLPAELLLDSYGTSCDIGLRAGQTWLVFVRDYNGHANVSACDYSLQYDTAGSVQDLTSLRFQVAEQLLNTVRQLTGRPIQAKNGRLERFYANGQRAMLTTYRPDGQEERTVWHANGRLRGKEFYTKGLKNGPAIWWNANGTLNSTERFINSIAVDTSRRWQNTDPYVDSSLPQVPSTLASSTLDSLLRVNSPAGLQSISVMNRQGQLVFSQQYDQQGRIRSEVIVAPETGIECSTTYDEQGRINFLLVTHLSGTGQYQDRKSSYRIEYQGDGSRQVEYHDNKDRLIRWTKVKDGKETVLKQQHFKE